ncbi:MAG: hypothetical protein M3540_13670 [Actinomycetota bacterium]|nr:hypothetical protein [Actinomycetota bacterium]
MGFKLKIPFDWCDDKLGNCELIDTHFVLFLVLYVRYRCTYQCADGIRTVTRNRLLLFIDF